MYAYAAFFVAYRYILAT